MARDRHRPCFRPQDPTLERRELLARPVAVPALVLDSNPLGSDIFHHNGINGTKLDRSFINKLNDRLQASKSQATHVSEAFQVFAQGYAALPPHPAHRAPALAGLISNLNGFLDHALSTVEPTSMRLSPSASRAPRFSPQERQALVPFAETQVQQLASTLAGAPADPSPAINVAANAIFNALAEYSVHPNLFHSPSDYYLNSMAHFTIPFSGIPAQSAPGYFVRGPGGVILPGTPPVRMS